MFTAKVTCVTAGPHRGDTWGYPHVARAVTLPIDKPLIVIPGTHVYVNHMAVRTTHVNATFVLTNFQYFVLYIMVRIR